MSEPFVSLVLPVYNQADHIASVVKRFAQALEGLDYEILLVPNGSKDESEKACQKLAEDLPRVRSIPIEGRGWGRAVKYGVRAARGKFICYTNAARTQPDDLRQVVEHALKNPGAVVKAARMSREKWIRRVGSLLYNFECRMLFNVRTKDINGTPKMFPREYPELTALERDDDLIDLEFLSRCSKSGYPVVEIPVYQDARHGGKSTTSLKSAWRMYSGALRYWRAQRGQSPR